MKKKARAPRQIKVRFRFLTGGSEEYLDGVVLRRDGAMVLESTDPDGDGPYLVVGKERQHWFEGRNAATGGAVEAKWTLVDDTYVGTWLEDGYDYLFSFQIP